MSTILVHVVLPEKKRRWQYEFPADTPPETILVELAKIKGVYGHNGTVKKIDTQLSGRPVDFGDPNTGFAFDNPSTIVDIGVEDGSGNFKTTARIRGPKE